MPISFHRAMNLYFHMHLVLQIVYLAYMLGWSSNLHRTESTSLIPLMFVCWSWEIAPFPHRIHFNMSTNSNEILNQTQTAATLYASANTHRPPFPQRVQRCVCLYTIYMPSSYTMQSSFLSIEMFALRNRRRKINAFLTTRFAFK